MSAGDAPAKPLCVLLVEDVEDDAALIAREIRRAGFVPAIERVETAEALMEALERAAWDVVIADHSLPRFSGMAALRIVREREPDLPFILVSGMIDEETAVAAMRAGAQDYVMKGNLRRLGPAIRRELEEASVRRRVADAAAAAAIHPAPSARCPQLANITAPSEPISAKRKAGIVA